MRGYYGNTREDASDAFFDIFPAQITAVTLGSTGSGSLYGIYMYDWAEQQFSVSSNSPTTPLGVYSALPGGRYGTGSTSPPVNPAVEANNTNLGSSLPLWVWMRFKGVISNQPMYEFVSPISASSSITVDYKADSSSHPTTPASTFTGSCGELWFDSKTGLWASLSGSLVEVRMVDAGSTVTGVVNSTSQNIGGPKTFVGSIPSSLADIAITTGQFPGTLSQDIVAYGSIYAQPNSPNFTSHATQIQLTVATGNPGGGAFRDILAINTSGYNSGHAIIAVSLQFDGVLDCVAVYPSSPSTASGCFGVWDNSNVFWKGIYGTGGAGDTFKGGLFTSAGKGAGFASDANGHPTTSGGSPAIAGGTGAGTSPTVSISGDDITGTISITPGVAPSTSATVATITFNQAYTFGAPRTVILTPANSAAALLNGTNMVFVAPSDLTTTTWKITSGTIALVAATVYQWYYTVLG